MSRNVRFKLFPPIASVLLKDCIFSSGNTIVQESTIHVVPGIELQNKVAALVDVIEVHATVPTINQVGL